MARPYGTEGRTYGGHADEPSAVTVPPVPNEAVYLTHTPLNGQLCLSKAGEENKDGKAPRT